MKPKLSTKLQKDTVSYLAEFKNKISPAMRKAGYEESCVNSGAVRKPILNYTKSMDFFNPKVIEADSAVNRLEARQARNYAVVESIDARRSKIAGMITDQSISKVDLTTSEEQNIVDRYIKQSRSNAVNLT